MTLSEIFDDPLDPGRSIQLNNKYWPGATFTHLTLIRDAEEFVQRGELGKAAKLLQRLKGHFGDRFFGKLLRRVHRLFLFRSTFGCVTGRIDLPDEAIAANRYSGNQTRAAYALAHVASFDRLIRENNEIYRRSYGMDVLHTNLTVRFAMPDERKADVTDFGGLSDYHNDEYKGISTIVYLSDVSEANGAFAFVEGSHLVKRSLVLSALHQCIEFDMLVTRPEALSAFPLEFRGSMGVGNFLEDDKADIVGRFCRVLEGKVGTFVTFNGQYVLHRGGKPLSGTRTAAFLQPEGVLRHKMQSVGSLLFAKLHA